MLHIRNIKMRTKVTLIVFLASIVAFVLAETITFKYEFKRYENEITKLTVSSSHLISDYCGLLLLQKTPDNLMLGIKDFARFPYVYDAIAINEKGEVLTEYHKCKDTITYTITNCGNRISFYRNGFVHVTVPITFNKLHFGKLYVRSFVNKDPLIQDILKWTIIIVLIQILFAFLVINLFHRSISNPLTHLIDVTRRIISDKNYSRRIDKKSFDEIGELYDEFNNLLETIDVHGQKRSVAENELIVSNERYKALVNNIPGVVFQIVHDGNWKVELLGEGVKDLTDGLPVDYFLGKDENTISKILSPESQKMLFERISSSVGVNREFESIYTVESLKGRQKWIFVRGRFIFDSSTNITTVEGILFDQTEKILAQELLKKTEKRYHDLFENLNDAAFLIDMESDLIVETNKEGEKLLGLSRFEIVDKLQKNLLCKHSDNLPFEQSGNTSMFDFYAEITNAIGQNIPIHVRSSIITIGEKDHLLCLVRDISERVEYEHNLKIAKEKAEESDNLKSMFLSNMSHEIRTPLNGFIGFSKLILSSKSQEETESYISIIDGCGKQLLRIIDDILDVSRIETGQMAFYNEEFSLNTLLDEIEIILREQLKQANKSNIILAIDKGLFDQNDKIFSDKHRLFQVIVNIASNAVKFTEQGQICISYKPQKGGRLEFKITDTGIGIDNEKSNQIFNRFTQADSSIAIKYGGSGLGLSIATGIVELMGGEIWHESKQGQGSAFYFTIKHNKK
jgi:PAS domain S-box-containing protein